MRELLNEDIYLISQIADKIGIKIPKITETVTINDKEKVLKRPMEEYGLEFGLNILKKIYLAKDEINQLLKNVFELSDKDISKMSFKETKNMIMEIIKKEEFRNFFK